MNDPFQVLGVSREATDDEIKAAYRKLAMQFHPDRNPGDKAAEEKFKEINAAHEELKDPQKRAAAKHGFRQHTNPGFGFHSQNYRQHGGFEGFNPGFDFEDIFAAMQARHTQRNQDITAHLTVSLEDAFYGRTIDVSVPTPTGLRTVAINVPPGIDNGMRLRVPGMGERRFVEFAPGDLYVTVQVALHPVYTRIAHNLMVTRDIDIFGAMLGAEIDCQTIDGHTVRVTVPLGVQNGQRLRVSGQGMPVASAPTQRGDLIVALNVTVPVLSADQMELLRKVRDLHQSA